jgi:hypothetical protein
MTLFNFLTDNSLVFYSLFTGTVGFIGYSCASSYLSSFYADKEIQTDAREDYSERPSQIGSNSATSIDTVTPVSPTITSETENTISTILPVPPVNIEIIPNPDLVEYALSHKSLVESKIQEINGLYGKEMFDYAITNADLTYIVNSYSIKLLTSSGINESILNIMSSFNC